MLKWLIVIIHLFFCINLSAQNDPILGPGMMRIYFLPQLHFIANTPLPGWDASSSESSRDILFNKDSSDSRKYRFTNGEYLFFDWWFMPLKGLKVNYGFELALDYADTYYHPVNMEHAIHRDYFNKFSEADLEQGIDLDKIIERMRFWKGKIEYQRKFLHTRLYKGYGHVGWENEGDLFNFYIEQWDIPNYRRIGAESSPFVFETDWSLNFAGGNYGKLSIAAGPEPMWGYGDSCYVKYSYKYRLWVPTLLFKYEEIEWGPEDDYRWALALTTKYYGFRKLPLEVGILFQPYHVDEEYTVTHKTEPGSGFGTSDYYIATEKTDYLDALGFIIKGNTRSIPFWDKTSLSVTYLGKIAGNMNKYDIEFEKKVQPYYSFYWQNIVQFPIEEAEILILEGTEESFGQPITQPRGRHDPFWVNSLNREAYISSLIFIYDPTPESWLFKYRPNILHLWNLNEHETSPFAFIFNYKLTYYPASMDLEPYRNSDNEWLWPGEYDPTADRMPTTALAGSWPLNRPVHFVTMIGEFKFLRNGLIVLIINTGEQVAPSALAYTRSTYELIPVTKMFESSFNVFKYPFFGSIEFGHNVWGPEHWYTVIGCVIDRVYKCTLRYNFSKDHEFEFQYVGYREIDNKYFLNKLGPFDEFRLSYKARFGTKFSIY